MGLPHKYKAILWDFDGVIMDSMPTRDKGFELVLAKYPKEQVDELMKFHRANGGWSRYVKFRHFFESIRNEKVSENEINELAASFSSIMLDKLKDPGLLIMDSVNFISNNTGKFKMHIVSGSDGNELRLLCDTLNLSQYYNSIEGSPTPKKQLVKNVLEGYGYEPKSVLLIGDSGNDLQAATLNSIDFFGYNNKALIGMGNGYIQSFNPLCIQ